MNKIRIIIGNQFQSPMSNMSFPAYFSYVNTAGKITARSLMEIDSIILTFLQEQETINEENNTKFDQIFEILQKLVNEKTKVESKPIKNEEFVCDKCGKSFKAKIGLLGHKSSHHVKSKV